MKQLILKTGQNLIIRSAEKEDASRLINYISKVGGESDFLTFGENEFDTTIEKEEEIIESYISAENKLFIIAEIDDKIVGSLNFNGGVRKRTGHTGEFGITVSKEYWGLGIGKELIIYMIDWAKNGDIVKKINLRTREDNEGAIGLYTRLGFKTEGIISRDFLLNGNYYNSICMGLEID